jgi:hypothetical protein
MRRPRRIGIMGCSESTLRGGAPERPGEREDAMIGRRTLISLTIAVFLAVAPQGAIAPSALGHESVLPTTTPLLTSPAGAGLDARLPIALVERSEWGGLVRGQTELPRRDPQTPMACRTRSC